MAHNGIKGWCNKVLPLVYDESLTYYELISKCIRAVNMLNENVTTVYDNIEELHTAQIMLNEYVEEFKSAVEEDLKYIEEHNVEKKTLDLVNYGNVWKVKEGDKELTWREVENLLADVTYYVTLDDGEFTYYFLEKDDSELVFAGFTTGGSYLGINRVILDDDGVQYVTHQFETTANKVNTFDGLTTAQKTVKYGTVKAVEDSVNAVKPKLIEMEVTCVGSNIEFKYNNQQLTEKMMKNFIDSGNTLSFTEYYKTYTINNYYITDRDTHNERIYFHAFNYVVGFTVLTTVSGYTDVFHVEHESFVLVDRITDNIDAEDADKIPTLHAIRNYTPSAVVFHYDGADAVSPVFLANMVMTNPSALIRLIGEFSVGGIVYTVLFSDLGVLSMSDYTVTVTQSIQYDVGNTHYTRTFFLIGSLAYDMWFKRVVDTEGTVIDLD